MKNEKKRLNERNYFKNKQSDANKDKRDDRTFKNEKQEDRAYDKDKIINIATTNQEQKLIWLQMKIKNVKNKTTTAKIIINFRIWLSLIQIMILKSQKIRKSWCWLTQQQLTLLVNDVFLSFFQIINFTNTCVSQIALNMTIILTMHTCI